MEEVDKGCLLIRMGMSWRMFLLVQVHPGIPGHSCVCVSVPVHTKHQCSKKTKVKNPSKKAQGAHKNTDVASNLKKAIDLFCSNSCQIP